MRRVFRFRGLRPSLVGDVSIHRSVLLGGMSSTASFLFASLLSSGMRSLVESVSGSSVVSSSHFFSSALREFYEVLELSEADRSSSDFFGGPLRFGEFREHVGVSSRDEPRFLRCEAGGWRVAPLFPVYLLVKLDEAFPGHVPHWCEVCPPVPPDLGP